METDNFGEFSIDSKENTSPTQDQAPRTKDFFDTSNFDSQWDNDTPAFEGTDNWISELSKDSNTEESPGVWDPSAFAQQAPSSWNEPQPPRRIQDLPSPSLFEPEVPIHRSQSEDEEWPFKRPCKMSGRKKNMGTRADSASDIDSEDEMHENGDLTSEEQAFQKLSIEEAEDDDIADDPQEERESLKSESVTSSEGGSTRRGRRKDHEPSLPRRGRGDNDDKGADMPSSKAYSRSSGSSDSAGAGEAEDPSAEADSSLPRRPRRRGSRGASVEPDEGLNQGSFHKLAKDFDKRQSRSSSRGRRTKAPGSAGSGRRRRVKDRSVEGSGYDSRGDDDADEFGEDEHEVKLKDQEGTPSGSRRSVRERRAASRGQQLLQAPGSGGRRPPSSSRRGQMRRSSSERWMRAVEGVDTGVEGSESGNPRDNADGGLSRSSHGVRRYHSGGINRMTGSLGTASYHGSETGSGGRRTPNRRPPRKAMQTPTSDTSGGNSFGGEDYEYELNLSGRSARTLDSIEDLEDFEHIDFQTPGMVDYDEEVHELMQRANPERTTHLQRRVARKREAVNYDQNMPMMTKQALMTRTASTQVQRQYVDQSTIDRRRLLVRSMSNSSTVSGTGEDLSMSQHRQQFARGGPSRRPPPRTRSSGMAALSRSEHPTYSHGHHGLVPPRPSEPNRSIARTKSGTSTSTFRHNQKPNRVQSMSRRADGPDSGGRRGAPDDRKGSLSRAQSMHATVGRRNFVSPNKPERRVPKSIDTKNDEDHADRSYDDSSSVSEDSDVESDDDDSMAHSPPKPIRKTPIKVAPPKPAPVERKKTDKRDFTVRRNRAKLHSMLYEFKMGVDMMDLLKQVQQGEVPRSPIKSLMMPSP
eukprot:Nitzschia sp. Nitz4//scaffold322_size40381//26794//29385//NITZ4_007565-RA/size40381-processed-gene-0.25-mRNA-1//-1//CDS//3329547842//2121//frame0